MVAQDLIIRSTSSELLIFGRQIHKLEIEVRFEKVENEYQKYRVVQDKKHISSMDEFYNRYINEENK